MDFFKKLVDFFTKLFSIFQKPELPPTQPEDVPGYRGTVLKRWRSCELLKSKATIFESEAKRALSFKTSHYDHVELATGVPWYVVAAIDMREEDFNHSEYLGNGDPWNKVSVHVPKGRGPFSSWYDGAIDALKLEGFDQIKHWDIVTALIKLELYNGLGYKKKGIPSPYVWAGTNIQTTGKYVADGSFDASAWDSQPGCAGLLLALKTNHGVDLREA